MSFTPETTGMRTCGVEVPVIPVVFFPFHISFTLLLLNLTQRLVLCVPRLPCLFEFSAVGSSVTVPGATLYPSYCSVLWSSAPGLPSAGHRKIDTVWGQKLVRCAACELISLPDFTFRNTSSQQEVRTSIGHGLSH